MYIEKIIIQGFQSYRNRTEVETLDPGVNVIVGHNGVGKTNIHRAIEFVLSENYFNLNKAKRQTLIFNDPGKIKICSAHVGIVFNNSEFRLPIQDTKVCISRKITPEVDQYFINDRQVKRTEIVQYLKAAGFMFSSSTFVIHQGKISQIAMESCVSRYKHLMEIAGASNYYKVLEQVDEVLKQIHNLAKQSRGELKLLADCMKEIKRKHENYNNNCVLIARRDCIELMLNQRKLDEFAKKNNEAVTQQTLNMDKRIELPMRIQLKQNELNCKTEEHNEILKKYEPLASIVTTKSQALRKVTEREEQLLQKTNATVSEINRIKEIDKKLIESREAALQESIEKLEKESETATMEYENLIREEKKLNEEVEMLEQEAEILLNKNQYRSKEIRDEILRQKINTLEEDIEQKNEIYQEFKQSLVELQAREDEVQSRIRDTMRDVDNQRNNIETRKNLKNNQIEEAQKVRENLKRLHREQNEKRQQLNSLRDELTHKVNNKLKFSCRNVVHIGADSIRKILKKWNDEGRTDIAKNYHGQLLDIIEVTPKNFQKAVQVAAGESLFFHLVADKSTATALLSEMKAENLPGTASFIPLKEIKVKKNVNYSQISRKYDPLLQRLDYKGNYDKAVRYVFGDVLLCRDIETSASDESVRNFRKVTVTGRLVLKSNAIKVGGPRNTYSVFDLNSRRKELISKIEQLEEELIANQKDVELQLNKIATYQTRIPNLELKETKLRDLIEKMSTDLSSLNSELHRIRKEKAEKQQIFNEVKNAKKINDKKIHKLHEELNSDYTSITSISEQERIRLTEVNREIERLKKELLPVLQKKGLMEKDRDTTENLLKEYKLELNKLKSLFNDINLTAKETYLTSLRSKLRETEMEKDLISKELEKLRQELDEIEENKRTTEQEKAALEVEIISLSDKEQEHIDRLERSQLESINFYRESIAHLRENIDKYDNSHRCKYCSDYNGLSQKSLIEELRKINSKIKKLRCCLNEVVLEKLQNSEEYERLRKTENLTKLYDANSNSIEILKARSSDQICFTLRQINSYFKEILAKLLPLQRGSLYAVARDAEESDILSLRNLRNIAGVSVKITVQDEEVEIKRLSAGQRTLVSLSFIIAVQKCRQMPFYIFDEIDAALSPANKESIANVISEMSKNNQIFLTTFSPELLIPGAQFYCVSCENGSRSSIQRVSYEQARKILMENSIN